MANNFVNFQDWINLNRGETDAMKKRLEAKKSALESGAENAQNSVQQQEAEEAEKTGNREISSGNKTRVLDATGKATDFLANAATNGGRRELLRNEYGYATGADAALLGGQASQELKQQSGGGDAWSQYDKWLGNATGQINNRADVYDKQQAEAKAAKEAQEAAAAKMRQRSAEMDALNKQADAEYAGKNNYEYRKAYTAIMSAYSSGDKAKFLSIIKSYNPSIGATQLQQAMADESVLKEMAISAASMHANKTDKQAQQRASMGSSKLTGYSTTFI